MKTSIIIPFYNRWDLTHQVLYDVYTHIPPNEVEIVLVNDASTDKDCENGVAWWQQQTNRHPIRYKKNKENLGFGGSMNAGAKVAMKYQSNVLVFLSNDVKIYGNFLQKILEIIKNFNGEVLIGGEVVNWDGGWNRIPTPSGDVIVPYANGWLLACTSDAWAETGGFDLRYGKYDFEDVDISTRFLELGYNIVGMHEPTLVVHKHQGSTISTLNVDRLAHTTRNKEIYIKKWADKLPKIHSRMEKGNGRYGNVQ